jgi:4-hydroxy-tetrahydrodipicolinate reductase
MLAAMGIKIGVFGAGGRMGSTVCRAVHGDPDLDLVAAVDPHHSGITVSQVAGIDSDVVIGRDVSSMATSGADVAIDFTQRAASVENLLWLAEHGIHAVSGTTGYTDDDLERFRAAFTRSNCFIAPNFAIGAVLMMRMAELAAPFFDSAEIIELHHENKIDAPSGTAMLTVQRMADASSEWTPDPTETEVIDGARGSAGPAGIRVHSVRLRGLVAHQEVLLGTTGQTLSIRHDSIDRTSFMPGVLLATKRVAGRSGVTIGLDVLLDL